MKLLLTIILLFSSTASLANEKEIQCLANAIYYEAKGESIEGKKAVANVLINRTDSNKFPKTLCKVVSQPGQFSWYPAKNVKDEKYHNIARAALQERKDNTLGALFFRAVYSKVKWKYSITTRIGNHLFFR